MKKNLCILLVFLFILGMFSACGCKHEYISTVTKEATCAEEGEQIYTCSLCNDSYTEVIAKTDNHSFKEIVTKEATCTQDGEKVATCEVCQKSETSTIAKNGNHTYTERITKEPTCGAYGTVEKSCTSCGDRITENIAKTNNHSTDYGYCSVCSSLITDLYPQADEIFDTASEGLDKLSESLSNAKKALNSKHYTGTSSAVVDLAMAGGRFSNAAEACGNYPEFKEAKALLLKISNRISNTFSGDVTIYGDYRDVATIQKIVNTMNGISPYMEDLTEIFKVWDSYKHFE